MRVITDQTKSLMSLSKKGINNPTFKGYYVVNGVKYESPTIAAKHITVSAMAIYRRCKQGNSLNYSFEPFIVKRNARKV